MVFAIVYARSYAPITNPSSTLSISICILLLHWYLVCASIHLVGGMVLPNKGVSNMPLGKLYTYDVSTKNDNQAHTEACKVCQNEIVFGVMWRINGSPTICLAKFDNKSDMDYFFETGLPAAKQCAVKYKVYP